MRGVFEDLRYAMRVLRRTPTLTAVAVLTLALGIAAITTVFGWIDGMVLHPFRGARDDGQLAVLESVSASGLQNQVSYADSRDAGQRDFVGNFTRGAEYITEVTRQART